MEECGSFQRIFTIHKLFGKWCKSGMNKIAGDTTLFKVVKPKADCESYRKGFAALSDWTTKLQMNHFCF